jgi:hypothetical protein
LCHHPPQQFDALLKEVVTAKRLSGSKIQALTDMAKKLMKVSRRGNPSTISRNHIPKSDQLGQCDTARRSLGLVAVQNPSVTPSQICAKGILSVLL